MSDRRELIRLIAAGNTCGGHYNCGPLKEDIREASMLLDAHDHELAETLRGEADKLSDSFDVIKRTYYLAANLIDPKERS